MELNNKTIFKIDTDYRDKYYRIGKDIYNEDYLKFHYADKWEEIKQKINFHKAKENISVSIFPSNEKMLQILEKNAQKIAKICNIKKIRHQDADVVAAALFTDYLVKHASYNMTTIEDRLKPYTKFWEINYTLDKNDPNYEKKSAQAAYLYNQSILRMIYNHIIYEKGVCSNYSHTLGFLMELCFQNQCVVVSLDKTAVSSEHAINLFRKENDKQESKFYMIDLTACLTAYQNGQDTLTAFMKYEPNAINASVLNMVLVGNSNLKFTYSLENENKILVGILDSNMVKKIHKNIATDNPYEDAIEYARYMIAHNYEIPNKEEKIQAEQTF